MSSQTQLKGIVTGILSGDSLIVRFVDNVATQVVCLEHLIAPKFGRSDGSFPDEPHGYNSWEYLRDLCINKRVLVDQNQQTNQTRMHPAFGYLPVTYTRVHLNETKEDVGELACRNGWVKLRDTKNQYHKSSQYVDQLRKAQEDAKANKLGIWADGEGFVRHLPVKANVDEILAQREFDCNVDGLRAATILSVFLLPNHQNVYITLAGCKVCYFPENDPIREEMKKDSITKFLNRKLRIRITSCVEHNSQNSNDVPTFIGCIISPKMDLAVANTIERGFATFYKKTAEQCLDPNLYIHKQLIAQKNKAGYWSKNEPPQPPQQTGPQTFSGIVTSIRGSSGLCVLVEGQRKIVYFNNIHVPRFSTTVGCEPNGFEAREYLRTNFRKKFVSVELEAQFEDRHFGTISMRGKSISEQLVEEGFATVDKEPVCGIPSSKLEALKNAEQNAINSHRNIHAFVQPEPFKFIDLTSTKNLNAQLNEFKGHKLTCIIEHILSTTRYTVLVLGDTKYLIRVALNGLLPIAPNDSFGHTAKAYCQDNLLQIETEIEVVGADEYTGAFYVNMTMKDANKSNVAIKILEEGYSEIHPRVLKSNEVSQDLIDAQQAAKASNRGIWQDKTRHTFDLAMGQVYPVNVVLVNSPTNIIVQHNSEPIKRIAAELQGINLAESKITDTPLKNECLVYHTKDHSFRVRVESIDTAKKTAYVRLIDYSQQTEASFDDLYKLPQVLLSIPPQGRQVVLAGLKETNDPKRGSSDQAKKDTMFIWELVKDACLYMHLVSDKENEPQVVLLDREDMENAGCLGTVLIQKRMATYQPVPNAPPQFNRIFEVLQSIQPQ